MKRRIYSHLSGFTIVELVVVIGIIGILAAIVLVAYAGVKTQGFNAQIIQGVAQYSKAIETYKGLNGSYPKVTGEDNATIGIFMTCLGTGYPSGQCGKVTNVTIIEDNLFNAAMKSVINTVPQIGKNLIVGSSGESFIGAVYGIDETNPALNLDSADHGRVIEYALFGKNVKCGVPGAYQYASGTNPDTTLCEIYFEKYPKLGN